MAYTSSTAIAADCASTCTSGAGAVSRRRAVRRIRA